MNRAQKIAAATSIAATLAGAAEGLRYVAYYDPPGILTVCRGHTGADVVKGKVYSLAECDAFLSRDMKAAVTKVESCVPGLPDNVLAAFSDAVFNLGPAIACDPQHSTAARALRAGKLIDACNQLPRWKYARVAGVPVALPGLVKRRAEEQALCLKGLS